MVPNGVKLTRCPRQDSNLRCATPEMSEPGAPRCPRQDSNLRTRLRRPVLYPLSYEGVAERGQNPRGKR